MGKIKGREGITLIELLVGLALLGIVLLGLVPVFVSVMRATVRDRWDTLATQRAEELVEIIKRITATSAGYNTGDTDGSGGINNPNNYQELSLSDGTYDDPNNPIVLGTGVVGLRANRRYSVSTTVVGITSYKTIAVWVEAINSQLLRTVTVETIISPP